MVEGAENPEGAQDSSTACSRARAPRRSPTPASARRPQVSAARARGARAARPSSSCRSLCGRARLPDPADRRDLRRHRPRRADREPRRAGALASALAQPEDDARRARDHRRLRHPGGLPAGDARVSRQRAVTTAIELPLVLPPAVAGIGLLAAFGPRGSSATALEDAGIELVLETAGVVVALTFVAAPFYLRQAQAAFAAVDPTLLDAARTLGAGEARAFARVAIPCAGAGISAGLALAWGRALGEFGATLMFAGSFQGITADGAAGDLRRVLDRLPGGAGALGGAGRGLGRAAAVGEAARRARRCSAEPQGERRVLAAAIASALREFELELELEVGAAAAWRSSGPRAPARARSCGRSPGFTAPTAAGSSWTASTGSTPTPARPAAGEAQLRLPVPGLRAVPAPERLAQRRLRARPSCRAPSGARRAARGCSTASGSASSPTRRPPGSRAASASGSPSRARWRRDPRLLLLDEPLSALDARTAAGAARELAATLAEARRADRPRHPRLRRGGAARRRGRRDRPRPRSSSAAAPASSARAPPRLSSPTSPAPRCCSASPAPGAGGTTAVELDGGGASPSTDRPRAGSAVASTRGRSRSSRRHGRPRARRSTGSRPGSSR